MKTKALYMLLAIAIIGSSEVYADGPERGGCLW